MPPHCDTLDGPVVTAAVRAIEVGDVDLVLPYVHAPGAAEVTEAFTSTLRARALGPAARDVADRYFFETVVRIHRVGEGAAYTGVKPAGLSEGPAIPLAEAALESGSIAELHHFLAEELRDELESRLSEVITLRARAGGSVSAAREHVEAVLGFEVYSHHTHLAIGATDHAHGQTGRP